MVPLILIFIILPIIVGVLWWYFILVRPLRRAQMFDEIYSANPLLQISVSISAVVYVAVLNVDGHVFWIIVVIVAAIMPPVVMFVAIIMLFDVHFYAFIITAILVTIGCYIALRIVKLKTRLAVTVLAVIPICSIPITVQGVVSIANIKLEYERMGGDCLSNGSFYQSIKNHGSSYAHFHAVMVKGDDVYIWSYQQSGFVQSTMTKSSTLLYAPTSACKT